MPSSSGWITTWEHRHFLNGFHWHVIKRIIHDDLLKWKNQTDVRESDPCWRKFKGSTRSKLLSKNSCMRWKNWSHHLNMNLILKQRLKKKTERSRWISRGDSCLGVNRWISGVSTQTRSQPKCPGAKDTMMKWLVRWWKDEQMKWRQKMWSLVIG